jgi:hypothetical protein
VKKELFLVKKSGKQAWLAAFVIALLTPLASCNQKTPVNHNTRMVPHVPVGTGVFYPVKDRRGYGVIDRNGTVLVEPSFLNVSHGYCGRTRAESLVGQEGVLLISSDLWVYVGENGAESFPPRIDDFWYAINQGDSLFALFSHRRSSQHDAFGLNPTIFDPTNRWNPPAGVHARRMLSEGLIAVTQGDKWGFADRQGKIVAEPAYDKAEPFFDGMAAVRVGELWGFIDKTGDLVIPPRFSGVSWFDDGFALVAEPNDEQAYFIDRTGAKTQDFAHDWDAPKTAFPGFINGIMVVASRKPRSPSDRMEILSGYIQPDGQWLMEPSLHGNQAASWFAEESAIARGPTGTFLVHRSGKILKKLRDVPWNGFRFGLASSRKGTEGYIDTSGKSIWKPSR